MRVKAILGLSSFDRGAFLFTGPSGSGKTSLAYVLADVSGYQDGAGKVEIRARIETQDEKRVVIRELPFGTTTESLISSIENAVRRGRLKVSSIQDYTTGRVEI